MHRRTRALPLGWVGLALGACAAPPRTPAQIAERARPALREIFAIPGLHGEAPRLRSMSADGEFVLVDWRSTTPGDDGERKWAAESGPFVVATSQEERALEPDASLRERLAGFERDEHARGGTTVVEKLDDWKPGAISAMAWSHRGHRLALAWEHALVVLAPSEARDGGADGDYQVLYRDPPKPAKDAQPAADAPKPDPKAWPERLGDVQSLEFSSDDSELVVRTAEELFVFPLRGGPWPRALSDAKWPTRDVEPALGGIQSSRDRSKFFAREKSLGKVAELQADGTTKEVDAQFLDTATGHAVVLEGMRDIASLENARLSPDGDFVFACEVDRSKEPHATLVPNYLTERVSTIESRKELADDTWPPRRLWMWSTRDGKRRAIELPGEGSFTFSEIGWAPDLPPRFAFRRLSSDYRTLQTWVWNEHGAQLACIERDEHWIGGPTTSARWSEDGRRILFGSESYLPSTTPGHDQLFALDPTSGAVEQLTAVEGELSSWSERDDGTLVIEASRSDPARSEIGRLRNGQLEWLPFPPGRNEDAQLPEYGSSVACVHEELGRPGEIYALSNEEPGRVRRLTDTIPAAYAAQDWILPQSLSAHHADGSTICAHVYLPRESGLSAPDHRRPCVVFFHGAGYLQNVTDSMTQYAVNLMFHSRLASMGYVVLDVDYRGSAGYGANFRGEVQFQLGRLELEDVDAVLDELDRRGVIDPKRIACYGGSYGGFLTLMALFTQPGRWSAGAALRSVTDWRTYHPGYTQPRLGRPSVNKEAYARSSPIDLAQNLRDPLLILHGMVDTNVFAQDSIRLIEKLIDLGLDFDAMLYPSQGHGFTDGSAWIDEYKRIERFLTLHLGAP